MSQTTQRAIGDDPLFSIKEIAQRLRVSPDTVRHALKDGTLKGYRVRGQWRFSQAHIDAWVKQ